MMLSRSSPNLEPTHAIRILVADRNRMESQLLAESLARDPRFEIVAVATAADLFSIVTTRQPHAALISADLASGAKKGLQIARNLHSRHPSIHIVILLETGNRESVIAAFRCGAAGVFCRTDPLPELPTCIERVAGARLGRAGVIPSFCLRRSGAFHPARVWEPARSICFHLGSLRWQSAPQRARAISRLPLDSG